MSFAVLFLCGVLSAAQCTAARASTAQPALQWHRLPEQVINGTNVLKEQSVKVYAGGAVTHRRYTLFPNGSTPEQRAAWVRRLHPPSGVADWVAGLPPSHFVYVGSAAKADGATCTYRVYVEDPTGEGDTVFPALPVDSGEGEGGGDGDGDGREVTARAVAVKWRPTPGGHGAAAGLDVYRQAPVNSVQRLYRVVKRVVSRHVPVMVGEELVRLLHGVMVKLEWSNQPDRYALVKHRRGRAVQVSVGFPNVAAPLAYVLRELEQLMQFVGSEPGELAATLRAQDVLMHAVTHVQVGIEHRALMATVYFRPYTPGVQTVNANGEVARLSA